MLSKIKKRCEVCTVIFERVKKPKDTWERFLAKRFCSTKCQGVALRGKSHHQWKGGRVRKICQKCKAEFFVYPYRKHIAKVCSYKCNLGHLWTEEARKKISEANIRSGKKPPSPLGRKLSAETRRKISKAHRGEKAHNWQGGVTPLYRRIYHSVEYKLWREAVFERDNFTCQMCGVRGGRLNADHIKPFAFYPELRFKLSNGRTLCEPCHRKTDTYGIKGARNYRKLLAA